MTPARTLGEPGDLTGFPTVAPPKQLVRVCRTGRATWCFSADGSGRFDLSPPEGTCYLATDAFAAIREATRLGPVSTAWAADRELRRVSPPDRNARLAATTRQAAGRYGVTTELATVIPYDLSRRWAAAFRAARFDGIRHQLRHDQRACPSGIALFGPAGPADRDDGTRTPLTPADIEAAGVSVLPPPHSTVLTVVP
ncbi:RES domain-containing protein [Mycolicibacter sp. MYC123]|uniref:RES domain-containing protein n=1 Tax=[Mycobacterium] zoologicum TaxID=2872311 RepID=A0ABU5YGI4_9MYCO|nr:RES domain-containing protein [Mycolicibacter sp. MYC123]MEB3049159.1 RES domain-containing protein [Mycolicibacter sp. MYC123]